MKRIVLVSAVFLIIPCVAFSQMVDNSLSASLSRIFPELSRGYIDINGNGRLDELDDINEKIPESAVKDSVVQVQEFLDFLAEYYPYLPFEKLLSVQSALDDAEGAIPEIISLTWKRKMADIIARRREMGEDTILLTPTALREAHETMSGYLSTMVLSYKKEGRNDERAFVEARNNLLNMLGKGYPLPDTLGDEEHAILVNTLIHIVNTSNRESEASVKTAVKSLGNLEAEEAVPYILTLMDRETYTLACIQALGEIGNDTAIEVLRTIADSRPPEKTRNAVLRAIGRIGGREGTDLLLRLHQEAQAEGLTGNGETAFAAAFTDAAESLPDRRTAEILTRYADSPSADVRQTAFRGLMFFDTQENTQNLLNKLKTETSEELRIEIIRSLNRLHHPAIVPSLLALLKENGISPELQKEVLQALGSNPEGIRVSVQILEYLGNEDKGVRSTTRKAILSLYAVDSKAIANVLARGAMASKDESFLQEATAILAEISDPDTLAALTVLLQNPSAEIKKNITWALYRIAPKDNLRLAGELAKLVSGETEALEVRINSVRALGAMSTDAPNLNVWQTLLTTAKMRGEEYLMLRLYAVKALGDLGSRNAEISETLAQLAVRDSDREIKLESLRSLRKLVSPSPTVEDSLNRAFRQSDDPEIRVSITEILGDLKSPLTVDSATKAFSSERDLSRKKRILYALSKVGSMEAYNVILDTSTDAVLDDFIIGLLEDTNPEILSDLVSNRLKIEDNEKILGILERLKTGLEERF